MSDERLKWETTDRELISHTVVFDVNKQHEVSATGIEGDYIAVDAPHWIVTVPVTDEGKFVLVRQWRHAEQRITTEFPGGVGEAREDPAVTAARELEEETGYKAGKMTHLGTVSPNPALFSNHVHFYLAQELVQTGKQNLDHDEVLEFLELPVDEVINNYGSYEYSHAFMGTALAFYMRSGNSFATQINYKR